MRKTAFLPRQRVLGDLKLASGISDTTGMTGMFSQINLLGNALRAAERNHQVVSQNVANVNTPNYKTRELRFDELIEFLESPAGSQELGQAIESREVEGLAERIDGNNVDLELEVSKLKKNALVFQAYSQLMSSRLNLMRQAIASQ